MHDSEACRCAHVIQRVTLVGALVNTLLAALKMLVGWLVNSQGLIADGVHSLSDLVTDAAVLLGARFWCAKPDSEHPYGHGRLETIVSILIGAVLAAASFGIAVRALRTMGEVHAASPGMMAFVVALVSMFAKEGLYRWTLRIGRQTQSLALVANAWHHRSDALSSLPVCLAVLGTHLFPGFVYLDHVAAVIVAVLLLHAAWRIAWPGIGELMEGRGDVDPAALLQGLKSAYPQIREIHKVRARRVGGALFVDLHMLVDASMSVGDSHRIAGQLEADLKKQEPRVSDVTIHVEPALKQ